MSTKDISRRRFLQKSLTGLAGAAVMPTILTSCVKWKGANDRILIGHVGVGSRAGAEIKDYFLPLEGSRSVAICDVFKERRDKGVDYVTRYYAKEGMSAPTCKPYLDMDEVFERDDIDAVHITTPDHWHVPAAIKAAHAGKHIMLAKPLGLSYPHYTKLDKALKDNDVRFHYGTQQRSFRHMQLGIEMIKEGKIGEVEKVLVWAPGKNNVPSPQFTKTTLPDPVNEFDYDRWTGPAPLRPYCPDRVTNNSSWFIYDYSIGFLAGWGAHPLDIMIWGLKDKLNGTYTCEGEGKFWDEGGMYNNIMSWDLELKYDSGVEVHFVSADIAQQGLMEHLNYRSGNGTTFFGSKGWISLSRHFAQSNIPELNQKLNGFSKKGNGAIREENNMGQMFLDVIQGKIDETCPLDEAIMSDTVSHMGDIAIRMNRKVTWNPKKGAIVGDAEANKLFVRDMRKPYDI